MRRALLSLLTGAVGGATVLALALAPMWLEERRLARLHRLHQRRMHGAGLAC